MISDKGLLLEERIAEFAATIMRSGNMNKHDAFDLVRMIISETGEEAAKMLDARKTSGGAGYVLMEMARDIRNKIPLKK